MYWTIFYNLCLENNTKPNSVCSDLGLSTATATHWKNGSVPNAEILGKVADYFNVSVDYLLGRKEKSSSSDLTENEQRIVDIFKNLTETQQGQVIGRAEMLAEMNEDVYRQEEIG